MAMYSHRRAATFGGLGMLMLLSACAQTPMGPTVPVMPAPGKSLEAFQMDQGQCKLFADQAVAGQAQNANLRGLGTAALTTALGAGLGGAIGGGRGAGIGAAGGALGGAGFGGMTSSREQLSIQEQYNNAFAQCMYTRGNQVPGMGPVMAQPPPPPPPDMSLTRAVQVQLVRLGYLNEQPDGLLGPRTQNAIMQFEQTAGLPVDGYPSQTVLARLQATR